MPIDIKTESIIHVREVPKLLGPIGRNGSSSHQSFVMRAILKGHNGTRLEAYKCGSRWLTSVEAVQRWLEAQAATAIQAENMPAAARSTRSNAERAGRELTKLGYLKI